MIGLDIHISYITDLSRRTVASSHSASKFDIRGR